MGLPQEPSVSDEVRSDDIRRDNLRSDDVRGAPKANVSAQGGFNAFSFETSSRTSTVSGSSYATDGQFAATSLAANLQDSNSQTLSGSQQAHLPSIADQLYVASFAVINYVLARLLIAGGLFTPIPDSLVLFWGTVTALLACLTLVFVLPSLYSRLSADLSRLYFSLPVLKAFALTALGLSLAWEILFERQALITERFFDSVIFVAWVCCLEEWLRARFAESMQHKLGFRLATLAPKVKRLEPYPNHEPVETECDAATFRAGELYRIGAGQVVPCDGLIVEGSAELKELRNSGLQQSKFKSKGHKVFAGSRIVSGELLCEALCKCEDSTITSFADDLAARLGLARREELLAEVWETRLSVVLLFAAMGLGAYQYGLGAGVSGALNVSAAVLLFGYLFRSTFISSALSMLVLSKGFYLGMRIKTAAAVRAIAKAKQLVFDFISPFAHEYYFVQNFVVVDQRVDKDALVHVLLNILGSSDEQRNEAITTYLRGLVSGSVTHRVSDSRSYEGKGMSAVVGGVEFSVGTEGFLIDRGVYLQASELVAASDNQLALYVAMRDELVAYLTLERKALADAGAFQSKLRAAGLKCVLCSAESPDKVDVVGKKLGLDLAYVHGDMSPERYIEKLRGDVASVFVIDPKTDPVLSKEAAVTVSFFDEFRWDIDRADVVLMREDLHGIVTLIDLVKRFKMTQNLLLMLPVFALLVPAFSMLWTPASPGIFVLALVLPLAVAYLALPKLLEPQA